MEGARQVTYAEDFLTNLENIIKCPAAYKLSDAQYDALTRLHDDAQELFRNGDLDGAHRVMKEMVEIVQEGPPISE